MRGLGACHTGSVGVRGSSTKPRHRDRWCGLPKSRAPKIFRIRSERPKNQEAQSIPLALPKRQSQDCLFLYLFQIDLVYSMAIEIAADEFQKSIMCIPEITSVIYGIFAHICKKQRAAVVKSKFSHIRSGIELLENKSDKDIDEIAKSIAVFSPPVNILKKFKNF